METATCTMKIRLKVGANRYDDISTGVYYQSHLSYSIFLIWSKNTVSNNELELKYRSMKNINY